MLGDLSILTWPKFLNLLSVLSHDVYRIYINPYDFFRELSPLSSLLSKSAQTLSDKAPFWRY